jgi:hypothetical protein
MTKLCFRKKGSDPPLQSKEQDSFARRLNDDATINSICPRCFVIVGHRLQEADLERAEQSHVCYSWRAEHYRDLRKALEQYRKGKGDKAPET